MVSDPNLLFDDDGEGPISSQGTFLPTPRHFSVLISVFDKEPEKSNQKNKNKNKIEKPHWFALCCVVFILFAGLAYGGGHGVYRDEGACVRSLVTYGGSVERCFCCGTGNRKLLGFLAPILHFGLSGLKVFLGQWVNWVWWVGPG
ncbi:hypothetical protein E1A91_D08G153100v1 [Gossypium mustelinum]|uniref:Transmembrane protein n=1 Tax=Gossypium mustelinum TaxID=34275 RepID=A0A5D2TYH0_GOSMU|nr:hypothetical protein E1A91_D08G153100v1 [Gossypium mustelinum]